MNTGRDVPSQQFSTIHVDIVQQRQQLADGYRTAGQLEEALAAYQKWVSLAPDDAKAIHMVDALKAKLDGDYKAPERASDAYVASYFDQYAKSFDSHTASVLRYQVPLMLKNLKLVLVKTSKRM